MAASEAPSCPISRLRSATFSDATRMKPPAQLGCSPRVGPAGFRCPVCAHEKGWPHGGKPFTFECAACGKQTSVTAGTIMHGSKLPLTAWFWAAYLMATHSNGISALQLRNQLGLGSYKSAWLLGAKLRRAMVAPGRSPLAGLAEVDETEIPCAPRMIRSPVVAGAATRAKCSSPVRSIILGFHFAPPRIVLWHGEPYAQRLENRGRFRHTFTAPRFFQAVVFRREDAATQAEVSGGSLSLAAGELGDIHRSRLPAADAHYRI
jgi:hypothetical protein